MGLNSYIKGEYIMPKRPKITITLVDKVGEGLCHRGHKIGDSWDYDHDRGGIVSLSDAYTVSND